MEQNLIALWEPRSQSSQLSFQLLLLADCILFLYMPQFGPRLWCRPHKTDVCRRVAAEFC